MTQFVFGENEKKEAREKNCNVRQFCIPWNREKNERQKKIISL
jgi:hypothetical protein